MGLTSTGEPGPMQDKECQASQCRELHLVLYVLHLSESTESKAAVEEAAISWYRGWLQ